MPRKEFEAFTRLDASDVNTFLMDQSVMTFGSATARDAAIDTPVEGQVTYLTDIDSLTVYNGTQWVTNRPVMTFAGTAARGSAIPSPVEGMAAYLEDSNLVSLYDGTDWKNSLATTGGILQVVQAVKTDSFTSSLAAGAITGALMSASITPTSTSSKVLILATASGSSAADSLSVTLFKNTSVLTNAIGNADGLRQRVTSGTFAANGLRTNATMTISFLDSPNTTSSTTYDFRLSHGSGITRAIHLNRSDLNDNSTADSRSISTITLMEVAG